jgi:hypothetical protein
MEESLRFGRPLPIRHESQPGRSIVILVVDHGRSEHVSRVPQVFMTKKMGRFEQKSAFTCTEHASIQELVPLFIRCAGGVNSKGAKFMASQGTGQKKTVRRVMHEYKHGELKAGRGRRGKVKNRKQAIAIALHEAGASNQESPSENKRNLAKTKRRERSGKTAASRKSSGRKSSSARKTSGRKSTGRKTTGRKTTGRKTTGRKTTGRKTSSRSTTRKTSGRKSTARKSTARKSTARKSTARRSTGTKRRTASRSTSRTTRRKSSSPSPSKSRASSSRSKRASK